MGAAKSDQLDLLEECVAAEAVREQSQHWTLSYGTKYHRFSQFQPPDRAWRFPFQDGGGCNLEISPLSLRGGWSNNGAFETKVLEGVEGVMSKGRIDEVGQFLEDSTL